MLYFFVLLLGVVGGGLPVYLLLQIQRYKLNLQKSDQDDRQQVIQRALRDIEEAKSVHLHDFETLKAERKGFEARVISYDELCSENTILKHDLQNVDVNLRKLQMDRDLQSEAQGVQNTRSNELATRFLKDNVKWIGSALSPSNYVNSKKRLQGAIDWSRKIGFEVSKEEETTLLDNLKREFEKTVRNAFEREEQARIKAQIREEQKLEKEIEQELKQLERERAAIQAALDKALAETKDEHSAEVEGLRTRLAEAEASSQRAISRAQMTKSGHVYVISNVGSFGEGVFKIGMTRRLDPMERVNELGSASVPFPFDVQMMISANDAPALENALHRSLHKCRVNRVKPRKEFFRSDIDAIVALVKTHHGEVEYVADAEALEYRQSVEIADEDEEFIESIYDSLAAEGRPNAVDDDSLSE